MFYITKRNLINISNHIPNQNFFVSLVINFDLT